MDWLQTGRITLYKASYQIKVQNKQYFTISQFFCNIADIKQNRVDIYKCQLINIYDANSYNWLRPVMYFMT